MNRILLLLVLAAGAVFLFAALTRLPRNGTAIALNSFAACLKDKRAVMYGAEWCPHCQNQKKLFGSSFRFINYVECPADPKRCLDQGIDGYPTWIFADGSRLVGEQSLETLSKLSGCPLVRNGNKTDGTQ